MQFKLFVLADNTDVGGNMGLYRDLIAKIRGTKTIEQLERLGFKHGENLQVMFGVVIDWGHCFLITIGDNVTIAPRCHILAHDASTKNQLGYTRIAPVSIGNDVFIGADSIVLPGVTIGDRVIIGAGSVVTKDLQSNGVYAGNPARRLCSYEEYIERNRQAMEKCPVYDDSYVITRITEEKRIEMQNALAGGEQGFIF